MEIQFGLMKHTSMTWQDVDTMPLYELFQYNKLLSSSLNPEAAEEQEQLRRFAEGM